MATRDTDSPYLISDDGRTYVGIIDPNGYPSTVNKLSHDFKHIADRTLIPATLNGTNKETMSRTAHKACSDIYELTLAYPNYYMNLGTETLPGGTARITAAIEYPVGVFTRVLFNKVVEGNIANGGLIFSDKTKVNIPKGARFWVRTWFSSTAAGIWGVYGGGAAAAGAVEGMNFGATTPDLTLGGVVTAAAPGLNYGPISIFGNGDNYSMVVLGDSRAAGLQDVVDFQLRVGSVTRGVPANWATTNYAKSGDTIQNLAAAPLNSLKQIVQGYDFVVISIGINDITNARTSTQIIADYTTLINKLKGAMRPNTQICITTINPKTTSTDAWATLTNQTVATDNAVRVEVNNAIRAGISGVSQVFDLADVCESSRDSGKWGLPIDGKALTGDGLHESPTCYQLIAKFKTTVPVI